MEKKLTYLDAGVDTFGAAKLVDQYKQQALRTQSQRQLMGSFGMFASAFDLSDWKEPIVVTGCDGVGTKLELLLEHSLMKIAGADLVAMSVNDVLTTGGDPLLFLDYIGIAHLNPTLLAELVTGIADALVACNCILAGGETAEMPGLVPEGVLELSGFCIGCVEKTLMLDPSSVTEGDVLVGWRSDGFHANGWSLVRRVLQENPSLVSELELQELLRPTRLYHHEVWALRDAGIKPRAYAHITGGGLPENLERILGKRGADLEIPRWENELVQRVLTHCDEENQWHTFNMGIGWVGIVAPEDLPKVEEISNDAIVLGEVNAQEGVRCVFSA